MLTTSLLRCRACRLTWFPRGEAGAACPACGGARIGGTLELFHLGIALIVAGLIGWMGPMILGEHALPAIPIPAILQSKEPAATAEKSPMAVKERRSDQVSVPSKRVKSHKVKRAKKAKKRSQHVQR
jgi:hypothetical protein